MAESTQPLTAAQILKKPWRDFNPAYDVPNYHKYYYTAAVVSKLKGVEGWWSAKDLVKQRFRASVTGSKKKLDFFSGADHVEKWVKQVFSSRILEQKGTKDESPEYCVNDTVVDELFDDEELLKLCPSLAKKKTKAKPAKTPKKRSTKRSTSAATAVALPLNVVFEHAPSGRLVVRVCQYLVFFVRLFFSF